MDAVDSVRRLVLESPGEFSRSGAEESPLTDADREVVHRAIESFRTGASPSLSYGDRDFVIAALSAAVGDVRNARIALDAIPRPGIDRPSDRILGEAIQQAIARNERQPPVASRDTAEAR